MSGREGEGAYSVVDDDGENTLYLFEQEDDAIRFAMMLEDEQGYPEMHVLEVQDEVMIQTCQSHNYKYTVITPNDIVIPPKQNNDFI